MIGILGVGVHFSGSYLFDEVSFLVTKGEKIGLAGKNGAGKSTMLKIIAGIQEPDEGEVAYAKDITIGYLPQEMVHQDGKSVLEEAKSAFKKVYEIQEQLDKIEAQLHEMDTASPEYFKKLQDLSDLQEQLMHEGGYTMEGEAEKVLLGLGFLREELQNPTSAFSGGWRMRIELAKILLQKPDIILLDEPTNHLDIESIQWLETFLKGYSGAVLLISHDRVFLDNLINRTLEISNGALEEYKGNYSQYLRMRVERKALQEATAENQKKRVDDLQAFVDKFRAKASKAKQAQSKLKALNRIQIVEVDVEDNSAIRFKFPAPPRSGEVAVMATGIQVGYGDKIVIPNLDFELNRGEKVAFIGKNGEGKSTLAKAIAGKIGIQKGNLKIGHNVNIAYYDQLQSDSLQGEKTVFQTIDDLAVGEMRTKVRSLLGAFLFSGETVDKKVKVLSGGEKSRLALAQLLLKPANLLILDEPTNHLDYRAKEVLKNALIDYEGALILISHDRDFLDGITNTIYGFRKGKISKFDGDIFEFLKHTQQEQEGENQPTASAKKQEKAVVKSVAKTKEESPKLELNFQQQKERKNEQKKLERKIEQVEKRITELESEMKTVEEDISVAVGQSLQNLTNRYMTLQNEVSTSMQEWEKLSLEIDALN